MISNFFQYKRLLQSALFLSVLLLFTFVNAQTPQQTASPKSQILILGNDYGEFLLNDTLNVQRLMRNVKLLHDSDTIYCDSAILYEQKVTAEAFGNVLIKQLDGTIAMADYMRYTGNNKAVIMKGNVQLSDKEKNELWSEEVTYNLKTKIGKYFKNGTLVSGETMVSSVEAEYNMKTKDARFKKDVVINDPEYHVTSTDLGYNTESKIATFFGPSVVTNENSLMQTSAGTYNSVDKTSNFWNRTSIFNDGQYIEGDSLRYDKATGWAVATGNVITIDTAERSYLYCGFAKYNELTKDLLAYIEPVIKKINDKDTLYMRGDTIVSGVITKKIDSISEQEKINKTVTEIIQNTDTGAIENIQDIDDIDGLLKEDELIEADSTVINLKDFSNIKSKNHILSKSNDTTTQASSLRKDKDEIDAIKTELTHSVTKDVPTDTLPKELSTNPDSTSTKGGMLYTDANKSVYYDYGNQPKDTAEKRFFILYYHVEIYSDSLQGKCDSLYYNQLDSTIRMMKDPVMWPNKSQMIGDVIIMHLDSNKLRRIEIPKNGILISKSGPVTAPFYDQIQGNVINAYLTENNIDSLIAYQDAANIYYVKDEQEAYVGVNESTSDIIEIHFKEEEINTINYRGVTNGKTTPMLKIEPDNLRLPRFKWLEELRIKSLEAFLKGKKISEPQLWIY